MIDPNSQDPSKRKSFFDEDPIDGHEEIASHSNQKKQHQEESLYHNGRERMTSRYGEEDYEDEYEDDGYDRRSPSKFAFMQGLTRGDTSTRKLTYAAGGVGALLVLFIGGWMFMHGSNKGVPVIEPALQAAKEKPADTGGMPTIGMGIDANNTPGVANTIMPANPAQPTLAPGPEQANPNGLIEQYNKPEPQPPVAVTNTSPATNAQATQATPSTPTTSEPTNIAPLPETGTGTDEGNAAPAPKKNAVKHHATQHKATETKTDTKSDHKKATKKSEAVATSASGKYGVQLSSLGSNSAAQKQWQMLRKKAPELLGAHSPSIQQAEVNGNKVYRLRVKGFASKAQAGTFCSQLKAKNITCTLAY